MNNVHFGRNYEYDCHIQARNLKTIPLYPANKRISIYQHPSDRLSLPRFDWIDLQLFRFKNGPYFRDDRKRLARDLPSFKYGELA